MFWIDGWVEATSFPDADREDEYAWRSIIHLGTLIDVSDTVSERLFGLSKECIAGTATVEPLAARRGLPSNPSFEVRAEIGRIKQHEREHGPGEIGGYTYATWQEIKSVHFGDDVLRNSDWKLVFSLLQRLEEDERFSDDRLRLVVWYNW